MIKFTQQQWLSLVFSILAGIGLAVMMQLNATLGTHIGVLESSFMVHLTGALFAIILLNKKLNSHFVRSLKQTRKIYFAAGMFGVLMVLVGNYVVPQLGMAITVGLFVTTAFVLSTLVDHFGVFGLPQFPITRKRIMGLLLALTGVLLVIWG